MSAASAFLVVRAGGRTVGLLLRHVREVLQVPVAWPVPTSRSALLGVATVRERLLPVAELATLLGDAPSAAGEERTAVLVDIDGRGLALAVDGADAVQRSELLPPPAGEELPGVVGILPDAAVPVLDTARLCAALLDQGIEA